MRVRWANVGRAAVVLGLLAAAVAWPRLAPPAPRLPSDEATPLATPMPSVSSPNVKAEPPRPRRKRPEKRRRRRPVERKPVRREPPPRAGTPVPTPAAPAPPRARPAPAPSFRPADPATTEFSFEEG
jgi:hypothetical protein